MLPIKVIVDIPLSQITQDLLQELQACQLAEIANKRESQHPASAITLRAYQESISRLGTQESQIIGRSAQREQIRQGLEQVLSGKSSAKFMFVCGLQGVGKTATVHRIIQELIQQYTKDRILFFSVNGMKLPNEEAIYDSILFKMLGLASDEPRKCLDYFFTNPQLQSVYRIQRNKVIVLVIDEIDELSRKSKDILYNILEWMHKPLTKMVVIGISNKINLLNELDVKTQSRCGNEAHILFSSYSSDDLLEILNHRLGVYAQILFEPRVLEIVCKRMSMYSSDVRRLLAECECLLSQKMRATDFDSLIRNKISMQDLELIAYPTQQEMFNKYLSQLDKLILVSIFAIRQSMLNKDICLTLEERIQRELKIDISVSKMVQESIWRLKSMGYISCTEPFEKQSTSRSGLLKMYGSFVQLNIDAKYLIGDERRFSIKTEFI